MGTFLNGRKIILGVTGSIAAFKTAEWVRCLIAEEALVQVVMTKAATQFMTPLTFAALSGNKVCTDMFDPDRVEQIPHINLARECDLVLIAPATAQTIARLANGLADDLLSAIVLATRARVVICPAMNARMFQHPATRANLKRLEEFGYRIVDPEIGLMACNEEGPGRLPAWEKVRHSLLSALAPQDLTGQSVLVTAGPTREPLDPVRFLSNPSSGKMGYALATAAAVRGAKVTLISGPTHLSPPAEVEILRVTTADEMCHAVMSHCRQQTVVIKAAAVSDFRPAVHFSQKVKKTTASLTLPLKQNRDILAELGQLKIKSKRFPLLVGFAAETGQFLSEGKRKLLEKQLDIVIINDISVSNAGFGADTNQATILESSGYQEDLPLLTKEDLAHRIMQRVVDLLRQKEDGGLKSDG